MRRRALDPEGYEKRIRDLARIRNAKLKKQVMDKLGSVCVRCGFTDIRALQVDHISGGGVHEYRNNPSGPRGIYRKILSDSTGYQLLCANCNWIKREENHEGMGKRYR